jgi:hypothetical protein
MHSEKGFWKPGEGASVEVSISHVTGISEIWTGLNEVLTMLTENILMEFDLQLTALVQISNWVKNLQGQIIV